MDHVVSAEDAHKLLRAMEEEFGELSQSAYRAIIIDAIQRGLVEFFSEEPSVKYRLQKPVEMGSENLIHISMSEPTVAQIKSINKGFQIKSDAKGNFVVDSKIQVDQTCRRISILGEIPEGVVNKIKRRDYAVLEAISDFFG